jgi:hypothetical protein
MTLRQVKVPVKSFHGKCDTLCTECATTRAVISKSKSLNGTGVVYGQIVPREADGASIWTEGCACFVNFEYDDVQLVVGQILKPCDLCLACGCIVDLIDNQGFYISDLFGNEAFIQPFETIQFQGINLATVTVSDANPNTVIVDVPCSEVRTCFSALDTATVDYTYNPVTGIHFADVRLSATAGNQITINPDGLYSPSDSLVNNGNNSFTHSAVDGSVDIIQFGHTLVAGGGSLLNLVQPNGTVLSVDMCPIVATCLTPQTPITPVDTPTVDLTVSGLDNHTIQADVIISPNAGNSLIALGNGLFVGAGASDSLVDNGDRTFTHTAVNGAVTNFCQGIQTIVTPNGCEGIGPSYAIKSASLNGCILNLNGAYEHTTIYQIAVVENNFASVPVSTVPVASTVVDLLINNPSACRNLVVQDILLTAYRYSFPNGVDILYRRLHVHPGGAAIETASAQALVGVQGSEDRQNVTFGGGVIPAGGSFLFQGGAGYTDQQPGLGVTTTYAAAVIQVFGSTA